MMNHYSDAHLENAATRALLIEDSDFQAETIGRLLSDEMDGRFTLDRAVTLADAFLRIEAIEKDKKETGGYDVILADLNLPDSAGVDTFTQINYHSPEVPIVALITLDEEALASKLLREGAQDYLIKEYVTAPLLKRAIRYAVERKRADIQLRQAKKVAESAIREKSEFLANITHEIRTPLNGIAGLTDLLRKTELTEKQRNFISMLRSSAVALRVLVDDILDLSRLETKQIRLKKDLFFPRVVVDNAMRVARETLGSKPIEIEGLVGEGTPTSLIGDADRLQQILRYLLSNAMKFTDRGRVLLEVHPAEGDLHQEPPSRNGDQTGAVLLRFTVSDTGIGIPPEKLNLIFLPFVQADGSMTRAHGGAGLGLSIASRLVEMMGGRIWAESEIGVGTRFHFTARFGLREGVTEKSEPPALEV